jgi:shikimate dehydrogenase
MTLPPASRTYAEVIGDPISHSKSPRIHGFWLKALGIDAEYRACHVLPDDLGTYIAARRAETDWRGCNVTIPHKQAIIQFLDAIDAKAAAVGAVNTVLRDESGAMLGTNTDVDGVAEAIASVSLAGQVATVLGAGGAARAAFAELASAGCREVRVLARDAGKAKAAARECGLDAEVLPFTTGTGAFIESALVINATQLGMAGQTAMPDFVCAELAGMMPGGLVFDMVYAPLDTALLIAARRHGLSTADGLIMLIGQAATAFTRFFGQAPPREADAELRATVLA